MNSIPTEVRRWFEDGELDRTLEWLEWRLAETPLELELLRFKARVLMELSQYDAALTVWRDVTAFGPPDGRAHADKARCLAELGDEEAALHELETALALDYRLRDEIEDEFRFDDLIHRL